VMECERLIRFGLCWARRTMDDFVGAGRVAEYPAYRTSRVSMGSPAGGLKASANNLYPF
jgi:hypothetical protein